MITTCSFESPVGTLRLFAEGDVLVGLHLPDRDAPDGVVGDAPVLREARAQLAAYFTGRCLRFELPLAPEGTRFQKSVWDALLTIPAGVTATYGEIAARIGKPHAARAVGMANHDNPIAIVIPCHRVIGASGKLTGYGGGLPMKSWLLSHESVASMAESARPSPSTR